jgi:predicted ATPase
VFLQRIVLEDLRSIEYLDLSLHDEARRPRPWTLLLGENGTGKTTLLRAVSLVLAGSDTLPELLGDPVDWVRKGRARARIRAEIVTADGQERTIELELDREESLSHLYRRNAALLDQLDAALRHTPRNYFTVGYGVSRRPAAEDESSVGKRPSQLRHPRARNVATLFSPHASLTSLEGWAMDLDYRREGGFAIVREAIDSLLPGISLSAIDRDRRELVFDSPDGLIPYRLLSEGYQNVAAWTGDLLYQISNAFEDYHDPFSARGLLLVDEIDLHLHPTWQRRLMDFVRRRFPNLQVVATTHSPLTAHQAAEGELFFLRRDAADASATLHAYDGAPRDLMLHQLLTSPIFGLSTLDSRPVELMKDEYRGLRDAEHLTPAQRRRLGALGEQLEDLPDWSEGIAGQAEVQRLMQEIKSQLP